MVVKAENGLRESLLQVQPQATVLLILSQNRGRTSRAAWDSLRAALPTSVLHVTLVPPLTESQTLPGGATPRVCSAMCHTCHFTGTSVHGSHSLTFGLRTLVE